MTLPIIQSKLQTPVIKDNYIRRAALTKKMKRIPEYPLTILHSGAGYGKSTALALFMQDEKINGCWYSISPMDDDLLPFLRYLIETIRGVAPEFGQALASIIETMERNFQDEKIQLLSSLFINEIVAVNSKIILILDDFHQIEHSSTINSWMDKLIQHIPSNLHIVISSRSVPEWEQLTKMKVSGKILEINKEDLILTIDEMELLLTDLYDAAIEPSDLQSIYQITEGWIIALCMIAQHLPFTEEITAIVEYTSYSLQDLFHYLTMEVYSKQSPEIKQFLEQTSVFEEIDEEMLSLVIGKSGGEKLIRWLIERNLFLQKVGQNQYRYHALFKEFLESQLRSKHPKMFRALNEKCARIFEKKKMWKEAIYHLKKIDQFTAIAAILKEQGEDMIKNGKLESLNEFLKLIPPQEMEKHGHLWYLMADVYRYQSNYLKAEEGYQKAYILADEKQNYLGMSKALEGKARIYLDTIQPQMAEKLLFAAISMHEKSMNDSDDELGELYLLLSENMLNLGKASLAEKWLHHAKSSRKNYFAVNLEARLYVRTGRFELAKKILREGKQKANADHPASLPQAHRETELLLSLIEGFSGDGLAAKELAQAGIQQGISLKAPMVEACGWIRMGHAVQLLNKYDLDLAEKCYQTSLEIMEQIRVNRGKAEPFMGLCLLYGTKGEFERAIDAGNKALQETERVCDVWLSGFITLCMGITSIYQEKFTEAHRYLEKTEEMFFLCEDAFGQMLSKFWAAYLFYLEKEPDLFKGTAHDFLQLVQAHGYEFFFEKRTIFGPRDLQVMIPLLIECVKLGIQEEFSMKMIEKMGAEAIEAHPGYTIRVRTLGQFKIWLGEKEVEEKAWQREKAKELFQLLVTINKRISKDEITQILWPNQDKQSADRDFKVALNTLHHVLEPKRKARAAPFFVIRDGMLYGINPHAVIELDIHHFQKLIEQGLHEGNQDHALFFLEKGLSLYHGEYLPERRYDDWCISKRESMLVYFLRASEKMAKIYIYQKNYEQAIYWCERIIDRDRTWEEAYRLLMFCYYRKNNRPQAIKWYQKCTEVLRLELGVTPLEPTSRMYEKIIASEIINDQLV